MEIIFKPVIEAQRQQIHAWLQQDYIRQWIHGKGLQNTFKSLEKFLLYQVLGNLTTKTEITQHWLGYDKETPFVYLLVTNIFHHIPNEYTKYSEQDGSMMMMDIFMVDPGYLGKGLASKVIKEFLLNHFSDVNEVFIDPEQTNTKAIHVYEKTGFKIVGEFIASWHPVPHYIMKLNMRDIL